MGHRTEGEHRTEAALSKTYGGGKGGRGKAYAGSEQPEIDENSGTLVWRRAAVSCLGAGMHDVPAAGQVGSMRRNKWAACGRPHAVAVGWEGERERASFSPARRQPFPPPSRNLRLIKFPHPPTQQFYSYRG